MGLLDNVKNWFGNRAKDIVKLFTPEPEIREPEAVSEFKESYLDWLEQETLFEAKELKYEPRAKYKKFDTIVARFMEIYGFTIDKAMEYTNKAYNAPVYDVDMIDIQIIKDISP